LKRIPTFIIEEHHEAFLIWNYAVKEGIIPRENNVLYHIDEHSDMNTPRFNKSIHDFIDNIQKVVDFTYSELSIANFIIPSIYLGMFNKVYWFKNNQLNKKKRKLSYFVRSYNKQGRKLISGLDRNFNIEDVDRKSFKYYKRNIQQMPMSHKKIVLDIDLDFFSCAGEFNNFAELNIQITKDEYESFIKDKYHILHCLPVNRIQATKKGRNYYYIINDFEEVYPCTLEVDTNIIQDRINLIGDILKAKKIKPQIITICRSRYSGFTPKDQWEFIEIELVKMLKNLYGISINYINEMNFS